MKLLFRQRVFSWFDSYDIYNEAGQTVFTVQGQLSWGHRLNIYDAGGSHIATLREKVFSFLPRFEIIIGDRSYGFIRKELSFFRPHFSLDYIGWSVEGSFMEWDYRISAPGGVQVASVSKELLHFSDTYVIDVARPADSLTALMVVLAIDAEKCSRGN